MYRVTARYTDKLTGKIYEAGHKLKLTEERAQELVSKGHVVIDEEDSHTNDAGLSDSSTEGDNDNDTGNTGNVDGGGKKGKRK